MEQGPDGIDSPTFLKQNFDVLEAVHQEAQLGPLEELFDMNSPYPEGINQLALRISTYEYRGRPTCHLLSLRNRAYDAQVPLGPLDQGGAVARRLEGRGSCQHYG